MIPVRNAALIFVCVIGWLPAVVHAQQDLDGAGPVPIPTADIEALLNDQPAPTATLDPTAPSSIDLLTLVFRGGVFMIPIALMSLMVVALAVERMLTLRKRRMIPRRLEQNLQDMLEPIEQFDPGAAFDVCRRKSSPAARVIMSMLRRTGQPLLDVERTATESIQREVDQASSSIQWLSFAAAATPLLGLLGTVWGMIVAFHESTTLTADRSRSEQLSEGIYTALVTTLAGLIVAIPAAMLALYLENRLAKLVHHLERLAFDVAPAIAQFAGRRRMNADGQLSAVRSPTDSLPGPPPVENATAGSAARLPSAAAQPTRSATPSSQTRGKSKRVS
jgi:biopolymer transport protein ExbB